MTYTDTTVNNLVINKMSQAQYDTLTNKSDTELYLVPDNYDTVPTNNSSNPITSGGVYTALGAKQDTIDSSHKLNADFIVDGTTNKVINIIESVEVNGVALTPDANKAVNVQVPIISIDVSADASSDAKTASPKAVKTYVDSICGAILTRLQNI